MRFIPNPAVLKMVAAAKGRYVYKTLITWEGPGELSLAGAVVRPKDRHGEPLPIGQPFMLTDYRYDGRVSSAWLSIDDKEYARWEHAFGVRRRLVLTVRLAGEVEQLDVQLTHVRVIPADFRLLGIDAAQAASDKLAQLIHAVWFLLRKTVPPRLQAPVPGRRDRQSEEAPPESREESSTCDETMQHARAS